MSYRENLDRIVEDATPKLETALATDSFTSGIAPELQLRYSQCGLASTALQLYLADYKIETERVIIEAEHAPKNMQFDAPKHVALRSDNVMIDPTYGQFMNFVGLNHKVAADNDLIHLYPKKKIMTYGIAKAAAFANRFADHAYKVDRSGEVPQILSEYQPDGALRGASLDSMQTAYQSIWNPEGYKLYTLQDPAREQGMHEDAERVVARMRNL